MTDKDAEAGDRECDGCREWHPVWLFNDEATELCDHCTGEWEANTRAGEKT